MALIFLKLGGSLITNKDQPYSPRPDRLNYISNEITCALQEQDELHLLIGHGSGSFGHTTASKYGTRNGVRDSVGWKGFSEVWYQASSLNRLVVESLRNAGLPVITISLVSSAKAQEGSVFSWDIDPIRTALKNSLVPIVHGDVVFDTTQGGTIISTEDIFSYLARILKPERILLAGLEEGVWESFPERKTIIPEITSSTQSKLLSGIKGATAIDVTGGMNSKVRQMVTLVQEIPSLDIQIFSGEAEGNILRALRGEHIGTSIHC